MKYEPLTLIDIHNEQKIPIDKYQNLPLMLVNDHVVRISIMETPYHWHYHPNSDEIFLGVEGVLVIELESQVVELSAGQLFVVPKNVRHRTKPKGERSVNLTFERSDIETVPSEPW